MTEQADCLRPIRLVWSSNEGPASFGSEVYRTAGRMVVSRRPMPELEPFRVASPAMADEPATSSPASERVSRMVGHRTRGLLGGVERAVSLHLGEDGTVSMRFEGVGVLDVAGDGSTVWCDRLEPKLDQDLLAETVLGPGLVVALGLQGVLCLHGSAVEVDGRVVALIGHSGAGKSTLAARLDRESGSSWSRLADDVLPVSFADGSAWAHSDFPQLKLGRVCPPSSGRLPLAAVCELTAPANAHDVPSVDKVPPRDAALTLVRHSVATRLFPPRLLARHLARCADLVAAVPVVRARYPHRESAVAELGDRLLDLVASTCAPHSHVRSTAVEVR